ncbi:MAG TPA: EAL domain-containing response regulator [Gemmatimonadaceae bacterium]|jgi:EAL domain-containing protein (putative c-di-GMP-specific phosphodiesterase class I)
MADGRVEHGAAANFDPAALSVLVIDDQSHVRNWVRTVLKGAGVKEIVEASDGGQALAAVTQPGAWFDLVLCDLRMPERDGIETIRAFAALGLESAIAIMSVEEERIIETAGMLAEVQGLRLLGTVAKPLTREKLEALFRKMNEGTKTEAQDAKMAPEADLANAFGRQELQLVYQPKISMRTGKFAGVESLVRWKHPALGMFQPSSFVPQIEGSEALSASLTEFSLRESIACVGRWREAGRELRMAVNLSARAFEALDLPERANAICLEHHVEPDWITLELTETYVARDAVRLIDVATRLRLKGFTLSIDDFGTGQSGLSKLQKLPFNELKIDRQFVNGCSHSGTQRSVVEASLALARSLKMVSVAEGVQYRPDWDLLNQLGCDMMQGFFIARPMSEEGLEAWAVQWMMRET